MTAISEVMTRDVRTVSPDTTMQKAAQLMQDRDVGALPVCNGQRLVGMVTDRDMTIRGIASGKSPQSTAVSEVMSESTEYCLESDSIDDVLEKMGEQQIRRLPVIDDQQRLVGIVSLGDLAQNGEEGTEEALERISEPARSAR